MRTAEVSYGLKRPMKRALTLIVAVILAATPLFSGSQSERIGNFELENRVDDFSGETRIILSVSSNDGDALLVFRCSPQREIFIGTDDYYAGEDDRIAVRTRFDDQTPSNTQMWSQSTSNRGAFLPRRHHPAFVRDAVVGQRLAIEAIDPLDGERNVYVFDLTGSRVALGKLPASCI